MDERLSGQEMLEVQAHLTACALCSQEYEVMRQVRMLLRSLKVHQPSPGAECRFVELINQSLKQHENANRPYVIGQFTSITTYVFSRSVNLQRQHMIAAQRSRRLAAAAAISAFGILIIASPFGNEVSTLSARALDGQNSETASMLKLATIPGENPVDLSAVTVSPPTYPSSLQYISHQQYIRPAGYGHGARPASSSNNDGFTSMVAYQGPFSTNVTFASFPTH
jgi:hypothetical protein